MGMTKNRPTSPHLQIYKPQLTSVLSIMHRFTGMALSSSVLLLCWAVWALRSGSDQYDCLLHNLTTWYGKTFLIGLAFSFNYHLLNGVRHLVWDAGKGYDLKTVYKSGILVLAGALILTVVTAWKVI